MSLLTHVGRDIPVPDRTPESAPYWDGAARGELWLRRCVACDRHHHYPRSSCPFCFAPDPAWVRASGRGTVYSYSVVDRAAVPYVIAWVTLEEGPTLLSNLLGCEAAAVHVGMAVRLAPPPGEGGPPIPMFVPA